MSYIGQNLPTDVFGGYTTDTFAGDGSATTFTLSQAPFNEQGLIVVINNVIQQPTTNYTVSGTTLTIVGTAVASGDVIYARHTGVALPIGEANALDLQGQSDKLILDADGDSTISADTDDQIDIKIAGADDFQFTANTFKALGGSTITTPTLGVGNTKDLGAGIHIKTADSSASVSTAADDLVIEQGSSGNGAGLSILSATDDTCNIFFGDSGDNDIGFIQYNHADNSLKFATNATSSTIINSSGNLWRQGAGAISMGVGSTDAGGVFLLLDGDSNGDFSGGDYSYVAHDSGGILQLFQDSPSGTNEIRFHTAASERARITAGGFFKGSNDADYYSSSSSFHEFNNDQANEQVLTLAHHNTSNQYGLFIKFNDGAPDNTTQWAIAFHDNAAARFEVKTDGDVINHDNSYGQGSDERIKENITDANSQWDDLKNIKVVNFERKDDVTDYGAGKKVQIGVIAQEVEKVSPGLVKEQEPSANDIKMSSEFGTLYTADDAETKDGNDEVLYVAEDQEVIDGNKKVGDVKSEATHSKKIGDIKSTTGEKVKKVSYSVLYMKAIKALQEAMAKIETLETKVKALEDA